MFNEKLDNDSIRRALLVYKELQNPHELNIGSWDVTNVTNMENLFQGISSFNENISSWDTSNVTSMEGMFAGCLQYNQPTNFKTPKVTNMSKMFKGCKTFINVLNLTHQTLRI